MAEEPENLILVLLRDIRAKLNEHDKRFDAQDERFEHQEKRFDTLEKMIRDWQGSPRRGWALQRMPICGWKP